MQSFSISPYKTVESIFLNKSLIIKMIKREVAGRYKGSIFGLFWSFFNPLLMLTLYTFVFSIAFKARWRGDGSSTYEFAIILFSGLMVYNIFAETITRSPTLMLSNVNYVKKVVFPLEILPVVMFGAAFFHFLASFFIWAIASLLLFSTLPSTVIYFPIILLPLMLFTLGISWFLASLGVYIPDISQCISIIVMSLMFLSPIFYPITAMPPEYQSVLLLNPFTYVIEQTRDVLIWGNPINWSEWCTYFLGSLTIAWLGFAWFQKTRKGFADVL